MKILIYGLPGSGKTTLAKPFEQLINGVHLNADAVREKYKDYWNHFHRKSFSY